MSRFDDLDHRLGRHEDKPHPDCAICVPQQTRAEERIERFVGGSTFYSDAIVPAFPNWGDFWVTDGLRVFVNSRAEAHGHAGGFWADTSTQIRGIGRSLIDEMVHGESPQLELGSGKWATGVEILIDRHTIPNEVGRSSPLGTNLEQWAREQNHAKLIVELARNLMFPVSETIHSATEEMITDTTIVQSKVYAVRLPKALDTL